MNNRTSWMNPKLDVRGSSKHGNEVFARFKIVKGERLAVFGGYIMDIQDEPAGDYALQIAESLVMSAPPGAEREPADYFNHACEPNAGFHGQIYLVAFRDITVAEQVCFDYAMVLNLPAYRFTCRCGSPLCRGVITGEDWKLPELQQRYDGYFSWYLQEKINYFRKKF